MKPTPYTCLRCRVPVNGEPVRPRTALILGLGYFLWPKSRRRCEHCGTHLPRLRGGRMGERRASNLTYIMRGMKWRCEKNGHLLDPNKHATCPIDRSPCSWQ